MFNFSLINLFYKNGNCVTLSCCPNVCHPLVFSACTDIAHMSVAQVVCCPVVCHLDGLSPSRLHLSNIMA